MPTPRIVLTDDERSALRKAVESPASSTRIATRARIVLALERNWKIKEVADALGVSAPTVSLWRKRFLESGIDGLVHGHESTTSDAELQRLLDAAERTMSKRGFCETRIADIAFEAGVSPSLIMYYFDSLAETLAKAMLHANERATTRFEEQLVSGGQSAVQRLAAFVERVLPDEGSQHDEYLLELDLLAHARQYPEFITIWNEHQGRWIAGLATIIRDGVTEGSFREPIDHPDELAQQILALVDGYGYQLAIGSTLVNRDSMQNAITRFVSEQLGVGFNRLSARKRGPETFRAKKDSHSFNAVSKIAKDRRADHARTM